MEPARLPDFDLELNPEQLAAVTHGEGPQLVLAGAGSGKTRVITYRIAWLVEARGVDPGAITAVTFTNKAASEMRERVEGLLGLHPLPTFVGTFHRFALRLLRRWGERVGLTRDFAILDAADQKSLVKQALADEGLSEKAFSPPTVLAAISGAKNRLLDHSRYAAAATGFFETRVARVFNRYQTLARQANGIDFDDMIALAVRLLAGEEAVRSRVRHGARYLLVDEFQDTNHAQLRLIQLLAGEDGNLTAVGDEDQGIYRWRGAELDNILEFEASFPGAAVRKLERNYRSPQNVLDAAGALVAHNRGRRGKRLWTDAGAGADVELYRAGDELDEARWAVATLEDLRSRHAWGEMAILVRTNAQTRVLEDELLRREVPYSLVGGVRFYERAEVKDLVAYLRILRNPRDTLSLGRIINQPPRCIGKTTVERLSDAARALGQPLWDVLYQDELGDLPARSAAAVRGFRDLIVGLQQRAAVLPLPELLAELLEATGYADLYDPDDPEGLARLENVREFVSAAREFAETGAGPAGEEGVLTAFLDHVALVSDVDDLSAERGVSLMTLHSAKGLEFEVVVVAGLEDGLLPHFNAQGAPEDVEEERRLLYVGMTRARERLLLSACRRRRIAGSYQDQAESPFVAEIPAELLRVTESPTLFAGPAGRGVRDYFRRGGGPSWGERRGPAPSSSAPGDLPQGTRVRHPTLGPGTVLALDGSGDSAKVTVFFDREGKRKLMARYANLEKL
jgi:ATP-dependent DNA helicase UvrD/PcrA